MENLSHFLWYVHEKAIGLIKLSIVEPRTAARLPNLTTQHAELGCAAACHVVTTFLQLDHGLAVVAAPPTVFFGNLDKFLRLLVPRAFFAGVPFAVAEYADLGLTFAAFPALAASGGVHADIGRVDPLAAATGRAVYAVLGGVLLVFCVPHDLELVIEETVNVSQGNGLGCAAPRRHVLRVRCGQGELSL